MPRQHALESHTLLIRSDESLFASADDEVVMLNPATDSYYGLDQIGTRIWDLLEQPTTIATIADTLRQEYAVDATTCLQDVTELLQDLLDEQLVHPVSR